MTDAARGREARGCLTDAEAPSRAVNSCAATNTMKLDNGIHLSLLTGILFKCQMVLSRILSVV